MNRKNLFGVFMLAVAIIIGACGHSAGGSVEVDGGPVTVKASGGTTAPPPPPPVEAMFGMTEEQLTNVIQHVLDNGGQLPPGTGFQPSFREQFQMDMLALAGKSVTECKELLAAQANG